MYNPTPYYFTDSFGFTRVIYYPPIMTYNNNNWNYRNLGRFNNNTNHYPNYMQNSMNNRVQGNTNMHDSNTTSNPVNNIDDSNKENNNSNPNNNDNVSISPELNDLNNVTKSIDTNPITSDNDNGSLPPLNVDNTSTDNIFQNSNDSDSDDGMEQYLCIDWSMFNNMANHKARERRKMIKKGNHYKDTVAETNIHKYRSIHNAIMDVRDELSEIKCDFIDIIGECLYGPKSTFDDACEYCFHNTGEIFFKSHPNKKKSCYSCKCSGISMLTRKQAIRKYTKLKDIESEFDGLDAQNKSVDIKVKRHYRRNTYYMIEDIEALCVKHFGSLKDAKKSRKRKAKTTTGGKRKKRKIA